MESISEAEAVTEFLVLVDEKLEQVLAQPEGWGGMDTLEPIVLVLSMLRARAADPTTTDRTVMKAYRAFLAARICGGAGDLRSRLGSNCSVDTMVQVLRDYADGIRQPGSGLDAHAPEPDVTRSAAEQGRPDLTNR